MNAGSEVADLVRLLQGAVSLVAMRRSVATASDVSDPLQFEHVLRLLKEIRASLQSLSCPKLSSYDWPLHEPRVGSWEDGCSSHV